MNKSTLTRYFFALFVTFCIVGSSFAFASTSSWDFNNPDEYEISDPQKFEVYNNTTAPRYMKTVGAFEGVMAYGVAVRGSYAYLIGRHKKHGYGFQVIDISNPAKPTAIGNWLTIYGVPQTVKVAGDYAYVSVGVEYGSLIIINISGSHVTEDSVIGSILGRAGSFSIIGNNLYINNSYSVKIFDIENPYSPLELAQVDIGYSSRFMAVKEKTIYLSNIDYYGGTVVAVDVSDPKNPEVLGRHDFDVDLEYRLNALLIVNDKLFLAGDKSLMVFDISDPVNITKKDTHHLALPAAGLVADELSIYVLDCQGRLSAFVLSASSELVLTGSHTVPGHLWDAGGLSVSGISSSVNNGYVYMPNQAGGLQIVDTSYSSELAYVQPKSGINYSKALSHFESQHEGDVRYQLSYNDGKDWHYHNGIAWVSINESGGGKTNTPEEINNHLSDFSSQLGFGRFKWRAYLIPKVGKVVSLSKVSVESNAHTWPFKEYENYEKSDENPWSSLYNKWPMPQGHALLENSYSVLKDDKLNKLTGIAVSGDYAYFTSYDRAGWGVIDISSPENPSNVKWYGGSGSFLDIAVVGDVAYMPGFESLTIVNVSDPYNAIVLNVYNSIEGYSDSGEMQGIDGRLYTIKISGNYAYVTNFNGIAILDISNPHVPFFVSYYSSALVEGQYQHIEVNNGLAYLGNSEGLEIVDVRNPAFPKNVSFYPTAAGVSGINLSGSFVHIGIANNSLETIDITDPTAPRQVNLYNTDSVSGGFNPGKTMEVSGNFVYRCTNNTLVTTDISDIKKPTIANVVMSEAWGNCRLAIQGQYIYIAGYSGQIEVRDLDHYLINKPYIEPIKGLSFSHGLENFTETYGTGHTGAVRYQLTHQGGEPESMRQWYYHNGSAWVETQAENTNETNTAAEINAHLSTFGREVGTGIFKWRAFMISDGSERVVLDDISVEPIANNVPTDIQLSAIPVSENTPVSTIIGQLSTDDADTEDEHTYRINYNSSEFSAYFDISGNNLVLHSPLDVEYLGKGVNDDNVYPITIETNDGYGGIFEKIINIKVLNQTADIVPGQSFNVTEIADQYKWVGQVETTGDYVAAMKIIAGNTSDAFAIDRGGKITVNNAAVIDYEAQKTFTLTVQADDGTELTQETVTINILDDTGDEHQVLAYRLEYSDFDQRYHVFMKPNITPEPNNNLVGQVTLLAPYDATNVFGTLSVESPIAGSTWTQTSRTDAPAQNSDKSYLSFTLSGDPRAIPWVAGTELEVFSFAGSHCPQQDSINLMARDDDTFDGETSGHGNQFNNTGWGGTEQNHYAVNYGDSADCRDNDNDGISNSQELSLGTNPENADSDGDSLDDLNELGIDFMQQSKSGLRNIRKSSLQDIRDTDDDGLIDPLDSDDDGDGVDTIIEVGNSGKPQDTDNDQTPDYLDGDDDGDGLLTLYEDHVADLDKDGLPNYRDSDDDGDGVPTRNENIDPDGDGKPDDALDSDGDGTPDYLDTDGNGIQLQLKALLQGAFTGTLMRDDLRVNGLLPNAQPYTGLGFAHSGNEVLSVSLLEEQTNSADNIVDWILIEIRSAQNPENILATQAALIRRSGHIFDANTGSTALTFSALNSGNYYIALRHRNHFGVMTAAPIELGVESVFIDFSDGDVATWGENARAISQGFAFMVSGDIDNDGQIIMQGINNDSNILLTNVLLAPGNQVNLNLNYRFNGYASTDLNMDGASIIVGVGNDLNLLISSILLHPSNTMYIANFIMLEQLP